MGQDLTDFFGIYDDELEPGFCREVIQRFEADERAIDGMHGSAGGGRVDRSVKAATEILLWQQREGWEDVNRRIEASLRDRLRDYMIPFAEAFPVGIRTEEPRVTRYRMGEGFYAWHTDNIGRSPTRVITAIWYLNDVAEGGETEYRWQDLKVQPREGRMVLCPVGWPFLHRGNAPVSGPKYMIITQLHQVVGAQPAASELGLSEASPLRMVSS